MRAFAGLAGDLALRPIQALLALLLLEQARGAGRRTPRGVEITLPGTRDEMAARIGTVRELVSGSLASLAKAGLIAVRGRRCVLLDAPGLEAAVGAAR